MLTTYRYRIYPNQSCRTRIAQMFELCDFVYNETLNWYYRLSNQQKLTFSKMDANNYVNRSLKTEYRHLKKADKFALTNAVFSACDAIRRFQSGQNERPRYRTADIRAHSYSTSFTNNNIRIDMKEKNIRLPKIGKIPAVIHRPLPNGARICKATLTCSESGKYHISLLVSQPDMHPKPSNQAVELKYENDRILINGKPVEIDLEPLYRMIYRKDQLASELVLKKKGSRNYLRHRQKLARIRERIKNYKVNFMHQISHALIEDNQTIITEVPDPFWSELIRQLTYKAQWNKRDLLIKKFEEQQAAACENSLNQN